MHFFKKKYLADLFVMVKASFIAAKYYVPNVRESAAYGRKGGKRQWRRERRPGKRAAAIVGERRQFCRRRRRGGEEKCNWWRAVLPLYSGAADLVCGNLLWRDG